MNIIQQFHDKINGISETFDRMIINGYILQMCNTRQFLYFLIQNGIKLMNFSNFANEQTKLLCDHIDNYIKENEVKLQYLKSGKTKKGDFAEKDFAANPDKIGLVGAYSVVELCNTMTVDKNRENGKLEVVSQKRKCKHYYLYYNDFEFGKMFVKIQTWFPYNVQIYINGREYLSKILDKENIKYEMYHNSFSYIENFGRAQELADGILNKNLVSSFDGIIAKINNHLPNIESVFGSSYYWCIDQCEFATDINFKCRDDLRFYKKLVETAFFTFSSSDIYSFYGRKIDQIHKLKKGEIVSDLRNRYQGYRIKFKLNNNSVKMYDKGNNLRIEVTINNPKDFKVVKPVLDEFTGEDTGEKKWVPMGKSVVNLYRYAEISKAVINRFINALPQIDTEILATRAVTDISTRKEIDGRVYMGFNLLNPETLILLAVIASGAFLINGFDNKAIRGKVLNDPDSKKSKNKMTRLFAKLRAHGLIKKVHRKKRYYLTKSGREICDSILLYTNKQLLNTA